MLDWIKREVGPQTLTGAGGGWTAVMHPFSTVMAGPVPGQEESVASTEINLTDVDDVKLWHDETGHYARPDVLRLVVNRRALSSCEFEADGFIERRPL